MRTYTIKFEKGTGLAKDPKQLIGQPLYIEDDARLKRAFSKWTIFSLILPHENWINGDWEDKGQEVPAPRENEVWECQMVPCNQRDTWIVLPIRFVSYHISDEEIARRKRIERVVNRVLKE